MMMRRFSRAAGSRHERKGATIDARIDTDTGEFEMVMATEGEASDGHILSMRGLTFPDELPLQVDHNRFSNGNVGIVQNIRRSKVDGVPAYRGVGRIRLTGDGEGLEFRKDLVDAISRGDIRGTSLTWDSTEFKERRDLPKTHPAHVKPSEPNPRKRFGLYFEKSVAIEQSIVPIPADREALIGRAEAAESAFSRDVWHSLADRIDTAPTERRDAEIIQALETSLADLEERLRAAEPRSSDHAPDPPAIDACLAILERQVGDPRARTRDELDDALGEIFERITGKQFQ